MIAVFLVQPYCVSCFKSNKSLLAIFLTFLHYLHTYSKILTMMIARWHKKLLNKIKSIFPSYLKKLKTTKSSNKIVARCHYRDGVNRFNSQFKILQIDGLWIYEISKFVHSTIYHRNPNSFCNYFLKSSYMTIYWQYASKHFSLPHN